MINLWMQYARMGRTKEVYNGFVPWGSLNSRPGLVMDQWATKAKLLVFLYSLVWEKLGVCTMQRSVDDSYIPYIPMTHLWHKNKV